MNHQLQALPAKERSGSRARCVLLTDGSALHVASRLSSLVAPHAVVEPGRHVWAPRGFLEPTEAKLGETAPFLSVEGRSIITNWWLAVRRFANTPNWDIVSQATIWGHEGLILVEAKAHGAELKNEKKGKQLKLGSSPNSRKNHACIGECINSASEALRSGTGLGWNLSRDSRYQMSNRFAWACKVAAMNVPVVLVYLGFLRADEMTDKGVPLDDHKEWVRLVKEHSGALFPDAVWGHGWDVEGTPLIPLIRSTTMPL